MRLDKFLKVSRIIKRRTVANAAADSKKILVNDNIAKPSKEVKVGDIITIQYYKRVLKIKVLEIKENVKAENADKMYEVLEMIEN